MLEPGYVFTFDGNKGLLAPEKINKLSTKRASRDYNSAVLNDLSFWTWLLAAGDPSNFRLNITGEHLPVMTRAAKAEDDQLEVEPDDDRWGVVVAEQERRASAFTEFEVEQGLAFINLPRIVVSAQLPTITINDMHVAPGDSFGLDMDESDFEELEEELEQLAEEGRQESKGVVSGNDGGQNVS